MSRESSALKGVVYGILFTLPIWAGVGWLLWRWLG